MSRKQAKPNSAILTVVIALLFLCCLAVVVPAIIGQQANKSATLPTPAVDARTASLTIAYSPEKAALMRTLADKFNAQKQKTPDKQAMAVKLVEVKPEEMVNQALAGSGGFQALTPDSSVWFDQLKKVVNALDNFWFTIVKLPARR